MNLASMSDEDLLRKYEDAVFRCDKACEINPRCFPAKEYSVVRDVRSEVLRRLRSKS